MEDKKFGELIQPFFWSEHEDTVSVCLVVGSYKTEIFLPREAEGFEGNGYDWASLAAVFLAEKMPDLIEQIHFDPEGSMYCAYSSDKEALLQFSIAFKTACENEILIADLFSRAELD